MVSASHGMFTWQTFSRGECSTWQASSHGECFTCHGTWEAGNYRKLRRGGDEPKIFLPAGMPGALTGSGSTVSAPHELFC